MYKFYYETLKPKYGDRLKLLFTDTDSLCCEIETEDLYRDMEKDIDFYDISNYDPTHPLYSKSNHRVLGKMKSETWSIPIVEFVGLKAKMYSYLYENKGQKKVKGIKKNFVKNTSVMKISGMSSEIQLPLPLQNSVILSQKTMLCARWKLTNRVCRRSTTNAIYWTMVCTPWPTVTNLSPICMLRSTTPHVWIQNELITL